MPTGDFGTSMRTGQPVAPVLMLVLGLSLLVAACALVVVVLLAAPLGVETVLRLLGRCSARFLAVRVIWTFHFLVERS